MSAAPDLPLEALGFLSSPLRDGWDQDFVREGLPEGPTPFETALDALEPTLGALEPRDPKVRPLVHELVLREAEHLSTYGYLPAHGDRALRLLERIGATAESMAGRQSVMGWRSMPDVGEVVAKAKARAESAPSASPGPERLTAPATQGSHQLRLLEGYAHATSIREGVKVLVLDRYMVMDRELTLAWLAYAAPEQGAVVAALPFTGKKRSFETYPEVPRTVDPCHFAALLPTASAHRQDGVAAGEMRRVLGFEHGGHAWQLVEVTAGVFVEQPLSRWSGGEREVQVAVSRVKPRTAAQGPAVRIGEVRFDARELAAAWRGERAFEEAAVAAGAQKDGQNLVFARSPSDEALLDVLVNALHRGEVAFAEQTSVKDLYVMDMLGHGDRQVERHVVVMDAAARKRVVVWSVTRYRAEE